MRWENRDPMLLEYAARLPGGTRLIDLLIESLEIPRKKRLLDVASSLGTVAAAIALGSEVEPAVLVTNPYEVHLTIAALLALDLGRIAVIPGFPADIPLPDDSFDVLTCVADPFPIPLTPGVAAEFRRVLAPGGTAAIAGAASLANSTPEYMKQALNHRQGGSLRTPAYTALQFAREGFHINKAEYIPGAWDLWLEWLKSAPPAIVPDAFRQAAIEDGGRWLSMGMVILSKPFKPGWAV
jgi:SAM-dependent methyltransferase